MTIVSLYGGSNESINQEDMKLINKDTEEEINSSSATVKKLPSIVTEVGKGAFQIFPPTLGNSTNEMAKH